MGEMMKAQPFLHVSHDMQGRQHASVVGKAHFTVYLHLIISHHHLCWYFSKENHRCHKVWKATKQMNFVNVLI